MTLNEIIDKWNEDADEYNCWDELSEEEKVEFAYLLGTRWPGLEEDAKINASLLAKQTDMARVAETELQENQRRYSGRLLAVECRLNALEAWRHDDETYKMEQNERR